MRLGVIKSPAKVLLFFGIRKKKTQKMQNGVHFFLILHFSLRGQEGGTEKVACCMHALLMLYFVGFRQISCAIFGRKNHFFSKKFGYVRYFY